MTDSDQAVKADTAMHVSAVFYKASITDSSFSRRLVLGQHLRKSILYSSNYQKLEVLVCERAEDRNFPSEGAACSNNSAWNFFSLSSPGLKTETVFSDDGLL